MPDDLVGPLLDELKTLEELRGNAEAARGEAEARITRIKSGSRLKDRHLWLLLWTNGDRSVYDEYRSLRDEAKHREQRIKRLRQTCEAVLDELDQVIAGDLEQNNSDYRGIVIEQRKLRRKSEVCNDALAYVRSTRVNITSLAASLHIEPKGRAAVTAAKKKLGEISAQLAVVRGKVDEVNRMVGLRGGATGGVVKKLNVAFLGTEFGPAERKKQLDEVGRTLGEVFDLVEASRGKVVRRLQDLEKDRARMVKAERDQLLVAHGLTVT